IAAVAVKLASGLEIRSSFEELLPADVPSVHEIFELKKLVGGDGTILVVVQSKEGPQGLKRAEQLGDTLAKEILALGPAKIRSVQSSMAPIRDWFENHWPLFLSVQDLEKARDTIQHEIRTAKQKANPLALEDDPGPPSSVINAPPEILDPAKPAPRERVAERF